VIGAWLAGCSRGGAFPSRGSAAVYLATSSHRRASRARRASAWASGRGRGVGRTASALSAHARVTRRRLGQLSGRLGHVTRVPGMDHRDGPPRRRQRRHHGPLRAPRGVADNQGRRQGLQALHHDGHPGVIAGPGPPCPGRPQSHSTLGVGDLAPNITRRGRPPHSCLARPCQRRAGIASGHGSGARTHGRDDPRSTPVSGDHGCIGLSRAGHRSRGFSPFS
jgi:hypothetical protein